MLSGYSSLLLFKRSLLIPWTSNKFPSLKSCSFSTTFATSCEGLKFIATRADQPLQVFVVKLRIILKVDGTTRECPIVRSQRLKQSVRSKKAIPIIVHVRKARQHVLMHVLLRHKYCIQVLEPFLFTRFLICFCFLSNVWLLVSMPHYVIFFQEGLSFARFCNYQTRQAHQYFCSMS
jgi:hypothetical protein